jgi:hypothetical protein
MSDTPAPSNENLDTARIMATHATGVALGLVNTPVVTLAARSGQRPKLVLIQGGRDAGR